MTGDFKQLLITVRKYESRVDCTPGEAEPPVPENCEKALEAMLARMKTSFFIERTSPLRGPNYVTLPRSFEYRKSSLVVALLDTNSAELSL